MIEHERMDDPPLDPEHQLAEARAEIEWLRARLDAIRALWAQLDALLEAGQQ